MCKQKIFLIAAQWGEMESAHQNVQVNCDSHTVHYYKEMDELWLHTTAWMTLASVMWNKRSHTQKIIYCLILFVQTQKQAKLLNSNQVRTG